MSNIFDYNSLKNVTDRFLRDSVVRNSWYETSKFSIYLRKSRRLFSLGKTKEEAKFFDVLDIANITIKNKYSGKGLFTEYLNLLMEDLPREGIYIENVLSERFSKFLLENYSWDKIDNNFSDMSVPISFMKIKR